MGGRSAGSRDGGIGPAQAEMDGDIARGGVGNHLGDDEGADLAGPAVNVVGMLLLELIETANAAADNDAAAVRIFPAEVQAAVLNRRDRRYQGELSEAIEPAGHLGLESRLGIEVLHLAAEVNLEGGGVELFDAADAAPAGAERAPEFLDVRGEGVDRPQSRD